MAYRKYQPLVYDTVAGLVLILAGLAGMVVRLGGLDIVNIPRLVTVEHMLPLLLIGLGVVLWYAQRRPQDLRKVPYGK